MDDVLDAFCTYNDAKLHGSAVGPLANLTFDAKDIFDIAGHVTGTGHPDWLRTYEPAADIAAQLHKGERCDITATGSRRRVRRRATS